MILIFRSTQPLSISFETYNGKERHFVSPLCSDSPSNVVSNVIKNIGGQATFVIFRFVEMMKHYRNLSLTNPELTIGIGVIISQQNKYVTINPVHLKALNMVYKENNSKNIFNTEPDNLFSLNQQKTKENIVLWTKGFIITFFFIPINKIVLIQQFQNQ
jgi:hypothetical protein